MGHGLAQSTAPRQEASAAPMRGNARPAATRTGRSGCLPVLPGRGMMPAMRDALSARPRVIVYVFASPLLGGLGEKQDAALAAEVAQICTLEDVACVETVVDRGPPKQRGEQYPVLRQLLRDDVDALLVVRSPLYAPAAVRDRLDAACPPGPFAWLSAEELRRSGLLPPVPATGLRKRRRPVAQRARALRAERLSLRQIGQVLMQEGYRPGAGAEWTAAAVATLLGIVILDGREENAADGAAPQ